MPAIIVHKNVFFVVSFDEAFNKFLQKSQMDLILRFWNDEKKQVVVRYFDSQYLGHTRDNDLLSKMKMSLARLCSSNILQISMDGPSTNWCLFEKLLLERHKNDPDLPTLVNVGSCGLHVVHGGFKSGVEVTGWNTDSVLRSLYFLLKDSLAGQEDFMRVKKERNFPLEVLWHKVAMTDDFLSFCLHRHIIHHWKGIFKRSILVQKFLF